MDLIIGFVAGLLVGWNFLPMPEFIRPWMEKISEKLKSIYSKKE